MRSCDGTVSGRVDKGQQQSQRQGSAVAGFQGRPASRTATRVAADYRRDITHCHEKRDPPSTGTWTGRREFLALPVRSVRSRVSSVPRVA
jgi:hypothetical protein